MNISQVRRDSHYNRKGVLFFKSDSYFVPQIIKRVMIVDRYPLKGGVIEDVLGEALRPGWSVEDSL